MVYKTRSYAYYRLKTVEREETPKRKITKPLRIRKTSNGLYEIRCPFHDFDVASRHIEDAKRIILEHLEKDHNVDISNIKFIYEEE